MKTLSISAIIVAGVLLAFGSGLLGQRTDSNKTDGSATNASASSEIKKEGSCCGAGAAQVQVATDGSETPSCCASSSRHVLVSAGADEKKECAGGSCCQDKGANVLTSTDATEKKSCAGGACCQEKSAQVLTTTEATEKACDGKDCKPNGECCEARKAANVLTSTEAADDKKCPSQCAACPVSAAMAKLPKMTFAVGTEKTCCSEQAKALAEQHKAPIQYVVAEKSFDCPTAAMTALVEETESFVTAFTSPKKCEASGNTTIAGHAVACPVEAEKQTVLVSTAIENIKMEYEVAGVKANCSSCAATQAKEKSAPIEYVVGEQKTTCQLTARLNLAHAKYKAAVQSLVAAAPATAANAG
ncbi:MAG: hypothetical protein Q8M16_12980 [Pirellulaceae bacterium]|nr:hypothetical protein [Pirellulaceae bacterium]